MRPVADRTARLYADVRSAVLFALALSVIALFLLAEPHDALLKADLIGFATCHRIPERSLHVDGHQLPLCARCTGICLGLLTGWAYLLARKRTRASRVPPRPVTMVLVGFIMVMGIDGLNSFAMLIPGLPHLYETQNWMRIVTGSLCGVALSLLMTPYVTVTLWREPDGDRTLSSWGELLLVAGIALVSAALALTQASFLLWPLVFASLAGVIGQLGMTNASIVSMLAGRTNVYSTWRDLLPLGFIGIALALIELTAINILRTGAL